MGEKRALIVDDSKSARLFLTRILEKYGIAVDSVESAEAAISYLEAHRPDVIFMDHLMPGMDGFQAVQAIKTDPRSATIPIMMYTSQEGEVYLGQARALGAIGVLPKQIKPADVSKVLYQLHLAADRRSEDQSTFRPLEMAGTATHTATAPIAAAAGRVPDAPPRRVPAVAPVSRPAASDQVLREQLADVRRALIASVDAQSERIVAEVRALARIQPPARSRGWLAASAVLVIGAVAVIGTLWWRERGQLAAARAELTVLRQAAASRPRLAAATMPAAAPAEAASAAGRRSLVLEVPYGAEALSGRRLETVRELLDRLAAEHISGTVSIRTYAGRFCLVGDPVSGYSMAPPGMAFARCAVVGNPAFGERTAEQRMPLALADLIGAIRSSTHGALDVHAGLGDPARVRVPYPRITEDLTAGEWNEAGRANNRVEIRVR